MAEHTELLIIGAGPYGLAAAAYARHRGIDTRIVGKPMGFWQAHMPRGMLLRSDCEWHIDALGRHTIHAYLAAKGLLPGDVEPLSRDFFLDYVTWFMEQRALEVSEALVTRLDGEGAAFRAELDSGHTIIADNVVVAVGFGYFAHVPDELGAMIPEARRSHTCDLALLEALRGKRCLVVGGRQSAFEWAALAREQGAAAVHVVHRHATPAFTASDWTWVPPLARATLTDPGWFRRATAEERERLGRRFWAEGRLKLEPWLGPRVHVEGIAIWPGSRVASARELDSQARLVVDQVILATGYRVQLGKIPLLGAGNLLPEIAVQNGFPALDEHFQSSVPGLFFCSLASTQDFGPFFGFVIGAPVAARLMGDAIAARLGREAAPGAQGL